MPGGDGTGPMGFGPMTGRAAGYCAGYPTPGFANPFGGRYAGGRGAWMRPATAGAAYAPRAMAPAAYPATLPRFYGGLGAAWARGGGRWGIGGRGMGRRRGRWF